MNDDNANHLSKESARVADEIRRQIYKGDLRTGDKLLPEKDLLTRFGVSRPTLREALRLLEAESLITIMRGSGGVRVRAPSAEAPARVVAGYLQRAGANLEDVYAARVLIEPTAARLFAANATRDTILLLEENITQSRKANGETAQRLFSEFAALLVTHCGNKTVSLVASMIQKIFLSQVILVDTSLIRSTIADPRLQHEHYIVERSRLIAAVISRDSESAETIWRQHLEENARHVLSAYWAQMPIDVIRSPLAEASRKISLRKK